jgi:hypothetical protein
LLKMWPGVEFFELLDCRLENFGLVVIIPLRGLTPDFSAFGGSSALSAKTANEAGKPVSPRGAERQPCR